MDKNHPIFSESPSCRSPSKIVLSNPSLNTETLFQQSPFLHLSIKLKFNYHISLPLKWVSLSDIIKSLAVDVFIRSDIMAALY